LPALEHHTYSEDDIEVVKMAIFLGPEVGEKRNVKFFYNFYSKSPLLDVGGFAKQCIKKYSPYIIEFSLAVSYMYIEVYA
jgi:hypothetical protein